MKDYERNDYLILYIRRKREYHMMNQYTDSNRNKEKNVFIQIEEVHEPIEELTNIKWKQWKLHELIL